MHQCTYIVEGDDQGAAEATKANAGCVGSIDEHAGVADAAHDLQEVTHVLPAANNNTNAGHPAVRYVVGT